MTSWIDACCTILVVVAAVLAAMGAMATNADDAMAIWFVAAWMFACDAVVGGVLALSPSCGRWSHRRRALAGVVAAGSAVVAPILLFETMARAACGCGDAPREYMLPTLFGVVSHDWVVIASIGFPVLMAATTAAALDRVRVPRGPTGDRPTSDPPVDASGDYHASRRGRWSAP